MPPSDPRLALGWTQSHLNRILQLLYRKYPALQDINYDDGNFNDIEIRGKMDSPEIIMPEKGDKVELFMVLRIQSGNLKYSRHEETAMNEWWRLAYRCDLSKADMKGNLSPEGLFQCLNSILIPDINEKHSKVNGWQIWEFKQKYTGMFEKINDAFKQWMNDQTANGLTQWGYRLPRAAKPASSPTPLVAFDINKNAWSVGGGPWAPRGLLYFEPPPGVFMWDHLEWAYRSRFAQYLKVNAERNNAVEQNKARQLPPQSQEDLEAEWDRKWGVGILGTYCDPAALNDDFQDRTSLLIRRKSGPDVREGNILISTITEMRFTLRGGVGNETKVGISPILSTLNNATLSWDAKSKDPKIKAGQTMSFAFIGQNRTNTNLDFVYFQIRFPGGSSGKRIATTTSRNSMTASAKASQNLQAKVNQLSLRGNTLLVVQVGLQGQAVDTKIRLAPGEKIEIELSGVAGTGAIHELEFIETLVDARGQNDVRKTSKWSVDITP